MDCTCYIDAAALLDTAVARLLARAATLAHYFNSLISILWVVKAFCTSLKSSRAFKAALTNHHEYRTVNCIVLVLTT